MNNNDRKDKDILNNNDITELVTIKKGAKDDHADISTGSNIGVTANAVELLLKSLKRATHNNFIYEYKKRVDHGTCEIPDAIYLNSDKTVFATLKGMF